MKHIEGDTKTAKDRLTKKTKATGIFGKRSDALKSKMSCKTCHEVNCKC